MKMTGTTKNLKIPKRKLDVYLNFVSDYVSICGLDDWEVNIKKYYEIQQDTLARTNLDYINKIATIVISYDLKNENEQYVKSILLHELIHTRLGAMTQFVNELKEIQEEIFVNDITRGIKRFTKLK